MFGGIESRDLRATHACQHPIVGFEHRDLLAQLEQGRCSLQPDIPSPDNGHPLHPSEARAQPIDVGPRADRVHAVQGVAGQTQRLRLPPGRPHQSPVAMGGTVGQGHCMPVCIHCRDGLPQHQADVPLGPELGGAQGQSLGRPLAHQVFLGEGRTLVGQVGLRPDQRHRAGIAAQAQRQGQLGPGLAGPDHQHVAVHQIKPARR
jgi:hypothetical protein